MLAYSNKVRTIPNTEYPLFPKQLTHFFVQMEEANMFLEQECHQVCIYLTSIVLFEFIYSTKLFKVTREEWKVVAHEIGHGFGT
jgi:hypothetical protein